MWTYEITKSGGISFCADGLQTFTTTPKDGTTFKEAIRNSMLYVSELLTGNLSEAECYNHDSVREFLSVASSALQEMSTKL
jgi:hypothetical protein